MAQGFAEQSVWRLAAGAHRRARQPRGTPALRIHPGVRSIRPSEDVALQSVEDDCVGHAITGTEAAMDWIVGAKPAAI